MLSMAFGAGSKRRRDANEATNEHTSTAAEMLGFDPDLEHDGIPEPLSGLGDTSLGGDSSSANNHAAASGSASASPAKKKQRRPGGNRPIEETTGEDGTQGQRKRKNRDIPDSLREAIISSVLLEGRGRSETAKKFALPWSTIASIVNAFEKDGSIKRKPRGGAARRGKVLDERHVAFLLELRRDMPATDVKAARAALVEAFPELKGDDGEGEVFLREIQRVWKDEAVLSLKRVPVVHLKRTEENLLKRRWERQRWAKEVVEGKSRGLNLTQAVFVEEAPFHLEGRRPPPPKKKKRKSQAAVGGGDDDDEDGEGNDDDEDDDNDANGSRNKDGELPGGNNDKPAEPLVRNLTVLVALDAQGFIAASVVIGPYSEVDIATFMEVDVLPKLEERRLTMSGSALSGRHIVMDAELAASSGSITDLETILEDMGASNSFAGSGHRLHVLPPGTRHRFSPGKRALMRIPTLFSRRTLDEHGSLPQAVKAILKREVGPMQCKRWIDEGKAAILAAARGEELESDAE